VAELKVNSCFIDGEVVVCDAAGMPSFEMLRSRQHDRVALLYAFDLLALDGQDLRREPLETRKATLASLLRKRQIGIALCEHLEGDGETIFGHACFSSFPAAIEYIKAEKLRALAVTTATRFDGAPDIPTIGEVVGGYEASQWYGVAVPKNVPIGARPPTLASLSPRRSKSGAR
jgi:hypothetical protein